MRLFYAFLTVAFLGLAWFLTSQVISPMFASEKEAIGVCGTVPDSPDYSLPDSPEALALFKSNCARCHSLNFHQNSTGPALAGLADRVPNRSWVYEFLRNPEEMLLGDEYALMLYEEYGRIPHPPFDHLSDEQVQIISDFILG